MNENSRQRQLKTLVILVLIILFAMAIRLFHLGAMALRADEAMTLYYATELNTIFRQSLTSDPHLPFYYFLLHVWLLLVGNSELAARCSTVFAGVLIVPLTFVLGRTVLPRRPQVALIGALLASVNPYMIWDAQDIYIYALLTATTLGSFILFFRALRPNASWKTWVAYVVVSALGLYIHYFAALILLAQGACGVYFIFQRRLSRRVVIALIVSQVAVVALFLPWVLPAWQVLTGFKTNFIPAADLFDMLRRSLVVYSVGRSDSRLGPAMIDPAIGNVLALGFLMIFLIGLLARLDASNSFPNQNQDRDGRIALALYLGVPLLAVFAISLWRFPTYDERFVLYLAPVFLLVVARGLVALEGFFRTRWAFAVGLVFVLSASGYSLSNYFFVPAFAKSPDWHGFVQYLSSEFLPGDVLIQNYPDPALPYYLQNRFPLVLLPRTNSAISAEVRADLDRLTGKYARIWFQAAPFAEWDTDGLVATWLSRHALKLAAREFRGARLELYQSVEPALRQSTRMNVTFAGHIRLMAFKLDAPDNLGLGNGVVHLMLFWNVLERVERDATVFVHLYDSTGMLLAQQDNPPVRGTYPTSEWQSGETIVDSYDLLIPSSLASGNYSLAVGMYDAQTQERLAAMDDRNQPFVENQVILKTFKIVSRSKPLRSAVLQTR